MSLRHITDYAKAAIGNVIIFVFVWFIFCPALLLMFYVYPRLFMKPEERKL